ncbi:MAG: NUDIX hydrolase [Leptospirales bacterium]
MKDEKFVRLAVDAIIENKNGILFIERKYEPPGWALPGGFVDYGETVEKAVCREVKEETGLQVTDFTQFHVYSDPERDPRNIHVASVVFVAQAKGEPVGSDDAKTARFFPRDSLPELAFDHAAIISDYITRYPFSAHTKDFE